jgi:hypothetical protein
VVFFFLYHSPYYYNNALNFTGIGGGAVGSVAPGAGTAAGAATGAAAGSATGAKLGGVLGRTATVSVIAAKVFRDVYQQEYARYLQEGKYRLLCDDKSRWNICYATIYYL